MNLYETGTANLWTDPHIREQMLSFHLDPGTDAASRNDKVREKTLAWILKEHPTGGRALDLGCGPGLYAERLAASGWEVVGIDINPASLDHARRSAQAQGLEIRYIEGSYLEPFEGDGFDLCLCIYCDFGALTQEQQRSFLRMVHGKLKPGGTLVLDVFGEGICRTKSVGRSWERLEGGSFWSPGPCYLMSETAHFESERIWGQKYVRIPDHGIPQTFVVWDHYFSSEQIRDRVQGLGFQVTEIENRLVGQNEFTSDDVLFVRALRV